MCLLASRETEVFVEYRRLGKSGVKVSEISLGSWLTYGGSVAEEQARTCIHKAYELGINFFDTANVYMRGAAEEIVGRALKGFERDSYFLATKVYFPMARDLTTVVSRASTSPSSATPR